VKIGYIRIAKKVNLQIWFGGIWVHRMSERNEFSNLFAMNRIFFQVLLVGLWLMHIVRYTTIEY